VYILFIKTFLLATVIISLLRTIFLSLTNVQCADITTTAAILCVSVLCKVAKLIFNWDFWESFK
jgi:hypothetical protein